MIPLFLYRRDQKARKNLKSVLFLIFERICTLLWTDVNSLWKVVREQGSRMEKKRSTCLRRTIADSPTVTFQMRQKVKYLWQTFLAKGKNVAYKLQIERKTGNKKKTKNQTEHLLFNNTRMYWVSKIQNSKLIDFLICNICIFRESTIIEANDLHKVVATVVFVYF